MTKFYSIFFSIFTIWLISAGLAQAQLWQMTVNPPPDNSNILPLNPVNGDNLGLPPGPHTATQNLDLNNQRIFGISSSNNLPAFEVLAQRGGLKVNTASGPAIDAITYSSNSDHAGLTIVHSDTTYALDVSSASAQGALFYGLVQVEKGVQLGNGSDNVLGIVARTNSAADPLYWGNRLLCNQNQGNCGWLAAGQGGGDGLGNHIATTTLYLRQHKILNVANTGDEVNSPSLDISGNEATSSLLARAQNNHGIFASSNGINPLTSAGLYAISSGNAPAITAASWRGYGASFSGPVEIYNYGQSDPQARVQFGYQRDNSLQLTAGGNSTRNLYWGNALLCDVGQPNCGHTTSNLTPGYWPTNAAGIHAGMGGTAVLIGTNQRRDAVLDIRHSYDSTREQSDRYVYQPVTSAGRSYRDQVIFNGYAYVGTNNGISIIDITQASTTKEVGSLALGQVWGVDRYGPYIAAATVNGLRLVDVRRATTPVLVGSYNYTASSNQGNDSTNFPNSHPTDVVVKGHHAYVSYQQVAANSSRLDVISLANPSNPTLVTSVDNLSGPRDLVIVGNQLFVAEAYGNPNPNVGRIRWYDISDPSNLSLITTEELGAGKAATAVAANGNKIYVLTNELQVYSYGGSSLSLLGSSSTGGLFINAGGRGLAVEADYAYAAGTTGIAIFDIANPNAIVRINCLSQTNCNQFPYVISGTAERISLAQNYLYAGYGTNGFYVLHNQGAKLDLLTLSGLTADNIEVVESAYFRQSSNVHFLNAGYLQVSNRLLIPNNQSLQLGGTVLDATTLQQLKTKAGL